MACFLIRDNKELHALMFKIVPFVRASFTYIMIYLFAFRGVNLKNTMGVKVWATFKYFLAAFLLVIIKDLVQMNSTDDVQRYFISKKFVKSFPPEQLAEIGISYILMLFGYAKLSKIPFFLTAHLWVIYYVNSYIFFEEVENNYSRFKNGFEIVHDATTASVKKFVKVTHEPPMAIALAGFLTFNFEIELLAVSLFNHALAIVSGYWAMSNHTNPIFQQITKTLNPYVRFSTSKLQHDIAYLVICAILSWHVHYWQTSAKVLSRITGRYRIFQIDPWTVPARPKTLGEKVHDLYEHAVDGVKHAFEVAKDETTHAYAVTKEGAKHAYKAAKDEAIHVAHVTAQAADKVIHPKKK